MSETNRMMKLTRQLGLGKLALYGWHRPSGMIRQSLSEGGPIEQWRTERGRCKMAAAAAGLPRLPEPAIESEVKVYFLSGEKYWYQTIFCFVSLQRHVTYRITPVVFDDGSFTSETKSTIRRIIPWIQIVSPEGAQCRLDRLLPTDRYPTLRARRLAYPHLRKLTDIHAGSLEVRVVLDSDMLFHAKPTQFLQALQSQAVMHIRDIGSYYGGSADFLSDLIGQPILEAVNVGLYALDGTLINWDLVEHWCRRNAEMHGHNYLEEQALTAMLLTLQQSSELSPADYIVKPSYSGTPSWKEHLHHYVGESKRMYFQAGWRQISTEHCNKVSGDRSY